MSAIRSANMLLTAVVKLADVGVRVRPPCETADSTRESNTARVSFCPRMSNDFGNEEKITQYDPQVSEGARNLLLEFLNPEQRESFREHSDFVVFSDDGKRRYKIKQGRSWNVVLTDPGDNELAIFSIHPIIECPDEHTMLAQKLLLDADENAFLFTANCKVQDDAAHGLLAVPIRNINTKFLFSTEAAEIRRILDDDLRLWYSESHRRPSTPRIVSQWGDVLVRHFRREGIDPDPFGARISIPLFELATEFGRVTSRLNGLNGFVRDLTVAAEHWLSLVLDFGATRDSAEFTLLSDTNQSTAGAKLALTGAKQPSVIEDSSRSLYEPDELVHAYREKCRSIPGVCRCTPKCQYTSKAIFSAAYVDSSDYSKWRKKHPKVYPDSKGARRLQAVVRSDRCPGWWIRHRGQLPD